MKLILTLDEKGGMMFNHRRQTKDSIVSQDIQDMVRQAPLHLTPYSAQLFEAECVIVDELPELAAGPGEYCLLEDCKKIKESGYAQEVLNRADIVILYLWNRHYPADQRFPVELMKSQFNLGSRNEFPGNSHDTITKEIYVKEK